jgi:FtsZ-interacting cell division protein YlmF
MTPNTIDTKDTFGYMDHDDDYEDEDEDEHEFCSEEEDSSPHHRQDTPSSSPLVLQYIRKSPRGSNRHHHNSTTEAEQLYFREMQDALAQERTKVADLISLSTQTILRRNRGGNRNTSPLQIIRWHDRLVLGAGT